MTDLACIVERVVVDKITALYKDLKSWPRERNRNEK